MSNLRPICKGKGFNCYKCNKAKDCEDYVEMEVETIHAIEQLANRVHSISTRCPHCGNIKIFTKE